MKLYKKGTVVGGAVISVLICFPFASTFLNENLYIKQFATELFVSVLSIWIFSRLFIIKRDLEANVRLSDLLIVALAGLYILQASRDQLYRADLVCYLVIFYIAIRIAPFNLKQPYQAYLKRIFPVVVTLALFTHIMLVVLQQLGRFPPLHGYFQNGSTFGNPDMLGAYMAVLLPFVFMVKNKPWRNLGYTAAGVTILLMIFIQARTAILALAACGLLWLIRNKSFQLRSCILLAGSLIVLLGALIYWHPESVYGRVFIWYMSLLMIIAQPWGWGLMAFEKHLPEFQAGFLATHSNLPEIFSPEIVHSPFNEFLNVGVTLGVTGLMLYMVLVVLILYLALKSNKFLLYPLFICLIISLTYFPFSIAPLMALVIPMTAIASGKSKKVLHLQLSAKTKSSLMSLLIISTLFLLWESVYSYRNFKKWQQAVLCSKDDGAKAEKIFSGLYPEMNKNGRFLITYANLKYQMGQFAEALTLMEEARHFFCDITTSLKLARLHERLGLPEKAEEHYELAIHIAPGRFTTRYEKILFLVHMGEYDQAYRECLKLYNKPIQGNTFADPYIIKKRVSQMIKEYEKTQAIHETGSRGN